MSPTFVIIGGSLTGASAAATLRQVGFDGDVILIGAEQDLPYERPPLSKQYLRKQLAVRHACSHGALHLETRISFCRHAHPGL